MTPFQQFILYDAEAFEVKMWPAEQRLRATLTPLHRRWTRSTRRTRTTGARRP